MDDLTRRLRDAPKISTSPPAYAINSRGELVMLDAPEARAVAKAYGLPDHIIGIPTSRWRRLVQRSTRR